MSELLLYSVGGTKKGPADFFVLPRGTRLLRLLR